MRLVSLGLDHTKAPAALREAVAFTGQKLPEALHKLRRIFPENEFVILSTCNRVELYAASDGSGTGPGVGARRLEGEDLVRFLAEFHGVDARELARHCSIHNDDGVVGHLFRVSSSVESVVLGEGQILGQVRDAYQSATDAQSVGWILHAIFQHALRVGKKVRETTGLGVGKLSVASVAVDVARDVFDHFHDKTVLVIGAGKMAELALTHLMDLKPGKVTVVNRSMPRAVQLAEQFGGTAVEYDRLNQCLVDADLVVSTTASAEPVVSFETYSRIQRARRYRLALILDIAIPRDFDDRIGRLDQVMLYNVDDLKEQVERNMAQRRGGLNAAVRLIESEIGSCLAALRHQKHASNVLRDLGQHADKIRRQEVEALFARRPNLTDEDRQAIERMAFRLQNQILHEPRAALRSNAKSLSDQQFSLPAAVGHLFALGLGVSYRRKSGRQKLNQEGAQSTTHKNRTTETTI